MAISLDGIFSVLNRRESNRKLHHPMNSWQFNENLKKSNLDLMIAYILRPYDIKRKMKKKTNKKKTLATKLFMSLRLSALDQDSHQFVLIFKNSKLILLFTPTREEPKTVN